MKETECNPLIPLLSKRQVIATSKEMKALISHATKVAQSNANIFIFGESGTGKEVLASYIHAASRRADAPYISVNCAAIPENLIESEFFGHVKGAFTGAVSDRKGRMLHADTGTLLLDEVTEIPLSIQPKLLRAIQEQMFEPVGSSTSKKVDVRFIATSNRPLEEVTHSKTFRKDLYYRLGVIPLIIPPLRQRKDDILPLAFHFLSMNYPGYTLSDTAKKQLLSYSWPGNVRELSNVIEHSAVIAPGHCIETITARDTKPYPFATDSLHAVELRHILEVVKACDGNKTHAAEILGISIRTLRNKLKDISFRA